jgi:phage gpG-like protein
VTDLQQISATILGETQYERAFIAYEREVADLREPLGGARDILSKHAREQFDTEGRHASGGWKQLNTAYEKWKQAHYPGKPILQRTAELRDQLVDHGTIELGPHRLVWGVHPQAVNPDGGRPAVYGARHQTGDTAHGLPQRKIVNLRDDEKRAIDREFAEFLNGLRHKIIGAPR